MSSSSNKKNIVDDVDFDDSVAGDIKNVDGVDGVDGADGVDDNEIEEEAEQLKISKEFQEMVIKFVKLDDLVRKKEKDIKELKIQRKPCEDFILTYLDKVGENTIDITNGKLRKNKSETKVPLNQNIIKDAIKEKVADPKVVEDILTLMDTMRPMNVRTNLKRTGKHVKALEKTKKVADKVVNAESKSDKKE